MLSSADQDPAQGSQVQKISSTVCLELLEGQEETTLDREEWKESLSLLLVDKAIGR